MENRRYFRVALKNFLATFFMSFAVAFTGGSQGLLQYNSSLLRFSLVFSTAWGLFSVAYKHMSDDDSINKPIIIKWFEEKTGIKPGTKDLMIL